MDVSEFILDFILTERAGIIVLLAVFLYLLFAQMKQQNLLEKEIKAVKSKLDKLGHKSDNASSDLSSLNSRISSLSGAVSDANSVAENTKTQHISINCSPKVQDEYHISIIRFYFMSILYFMEGNCIKFVSYIKITIFRNHFAFIR